MTNAFNDFRRRLQALSISQGTIICDGSGGELSQLSRLELFLHADEVAPAVFETAIATNDVLVVSNCLCLDCCR